jgi:predicted lysophospholipase L1 biosynthesis ABC-type transport system permease subunit
MQTSQLNVTTVIPEGYTLPQGTDNVSVMSAYAGDGYFSTIGIPIVRGREFRTEDSPNAPLVGIVNERFAQHYWPGVDALGKRLRVKNAGRAETLVEVVGVAKNSKYVLLAEPPTEYIYFTVRQNPRTNLILLTQSESDPHDLVTPLRNVLRSLDPALPVYDVQTMQEFYDISTVGLMDTIIGTIATMGTMGLALSLVGLYGLVAYAASRRTKEIGIRMALGADRLSVLGLVMKQGIVLSAAGLAVGLLASAVVGELLAATFVGRSAGNNRDFMSLLLVAGAVLVVTGLAAYLPARRASRVDPVNALRYE